MKPRIPWMRARLGAAALAVLAASPDPLAGAQEDARPWNQPRGSSGSSAASDVEPILARPIEAWRHDFDAVVSEPVAWGGALYVAARDRTASKLFAFRIADGERLAETRVPANGSVALAVEQGTVAVVDGDAIRTYTHKGDRFVRGRELKAGTQWIEAPALHEGYLLAIDGTDLTLIELQRLKRLGSVPAGVGRPAVGRVGPENDLIVATVAYGPYTTDKRDHLKLMLAQVRGIGEERPTLSSYGSRTFITVASAESDAGAYAAFVRSDDHDGQWFLGSPRRLAVRAKSSRHGLLTRSGSALPIVSQVAVRDGEIFGFDDEGALVRALASGASSQVVAAGNMPAGARSGNVTAASGVLYLGNWALDIESRRVLWCLEDLEASSSLLPIADRRVLYATPTAIVCLADPRDAALAEEIGSKPGLGRPSSGDGVVLADGRFVAGAVAIEPDGAVRLEGATFQPGEVALVVRADEVVRLGPEYPVFLAWLRALHAEAVERLEGLFASYLRTRHVHDCGRLLAEARTYGLDTARGRELEDQLAGKTQNQNANAGAQRAVKVAEERREREALVASYLRAADWCGARGLGNAATVLVGEAAGMLPDGERADLAARVKPWIPPQFPWARAEDAAQRWIAWATELLPANATFCEWNDPVWSRATKPPWSEGAIAIRTEHLEVLTLALDPAVIGACVRSGEGALLALEELLGPPARARSDGLDVRIHADREAYLAEKLPSGTYANPWSVGFYLSGQKASRFYVPRGQNAELLGRDLDQVVVHELTHHYIDMVWRAPLGAPALTRPGYWVVEGIARYVEDQVLELGRAARRFDDPTVRSLDLASQADAAGALLPIAKLIDCSYLDFGKLSFEPSLPLRPRFTLRAFHLSQANVFYEQAGSLVFYLLNRRGEEGRRALVDYLRAYYAGRTEPQGWKRLGWPDAQALERDFKEFLKTVREG